MPLLILSLVAEGCVVVGGAGGAGAGAGRSCGALSKEKVNCLPFSVGLEGLWP